MHGRVARQYRGCNTSGISVCLPLQVQPHFQEPRQIALTRIQASELRIGDVNAGDCSEPGMIECVYCFKPIVQPNLLRDSERFRDRSVPVLIPRKPDIAEPERERTE